MQKFYARSGNITVLFEVKNDVWSALCLNNTYLYEIDGIYWGKELTSNDQICHLIRNHEFVPDFRCEYGHRFMILKWNVPLFSLDIEIVLEGRELTQNKSVCSKASNIPERKDTILFCPEMGIKFTNQEHAKQIINDITTSGIKCHKLDDIYQLNGLDDFDIYKTLHSGGFRIVDAKYIEIPINTSSWMFGVKKELGARNYITVIEYVKDSFDRVSIFKKYTTEHLQILFSEFSPDNKIVFLPNDTIAIYKY